MLKKILAYFQPKQRKFKISFRAIFNDNNELFDVYTIEAPTEKAAIKKITKQFKKVEQFSINRITEI